MKWHKSKTKKTKTNTEPQQTMGSELNNRSTTTEPPPLSCLYSLSKNVVCFVNCCIYSSLLVYHNWTVDQDISWLSVIATNSE